MQLSQLPVKTQLPFAATGSRNTIPVASQQATTPGAASFTDGFPPQTMQPIESGGTPPFGQDFNGVFFHTTSLTRWFSAGGPMMFDAAFAAAIGGYPMGARLTSAASPNVLWISTIDNNSNNPDSGTSAGLTGWLQVPLNAFTPVQQGGGIGQLANKVYLGYSSAGKLRLTIDATDFGNVALETWVAAQVQAEANGRAFDVGNLQTALNGEAGVRASQDARLFNSFANVRGTHIQQRFVPGDGWTMTNTLSFTNGPAYGYMHLVASANLAGTAPLACGNQLLVNGQNVNADSTPNSQTAHGVVVVSPNGTYTIQQTFTTGNSGGQAYPTCSINLSYVVVSGSPT